MSWSGNLCPLPDLTFNSPSEETLWESGLLSTCRPYSRWCRVWMLSFPSPQSGVSRLALLCCLGKQTQVWFGNQSTRELSNFLAEKSPQTLACVISMLFQEKMLCQEVTSESKTWSACHTHCLNYIAKLSTINKRTHGTMYLLMWYNKTCTLSS